MIALLCALALSGGHRVALVVGENAGDAGDAPLEYAESDASAFDQVLRELGGVPPEDATLLRGAQAADLRRALEALRERKLTKEDRLIIYVSAHAAGGELHLRGTHYPLADLRRFVDASSAGLVLLIVDTCDAAAAMRAKGLVPLSSRVVQVEQIPISGHVIIASAGPDQSAFESSDLGGSLFTQHFIAGLRGAADVSHDGHVTLQEAYRYAYTRTVDSAAALQAAPQTPLFDMDLEGAGELIVTELQRARARLTLAIAAPGDWTVSALDGSSTALRFVKTAGSAELALQPGIYRLRTQVGDSLAERIVTLSEGQAITVSDSDLRRWPLLPAGRKGAGSLTRVEAFGGVSSAAVSGVGVLAGGGVEVQHRFDAQGALRPLLSAQLAFAGGAPSDAAFLERELAAALGAGFEVSSGTLSLRALAEAGAAFVHQAARTGVTAAEPRVDGAIDAGWTFSYPWSLEVSARSGALLTRTTTRHLQPLFAATGGLGVSF